MFERTKLIFLYNLGLLVYSFFVLDDLVQMTVAISRELTLKQLNQIWLYKHCFAIKSVDESVDSDSDIDENHGQDTSSDEDEEEFKREEESSEDEDEESRPRSRH